MSIKSINRDNRIIIKNFSYLALLRSFNIGAKFLLAAYLIRVLGENNYGIYVWSDSIIQYLLIFVNFGFNIYAAKYIIDNKNNKLEIDTIVSSIFSLKFIFFIISFFILLLLSYFNPIKTHLNILLLLLTMGLGEVFYPIWYFQGLEKLKPATIIIGISRLSLLLFSFKFVNSPDDLYLFIILVVLSNLLMGILGYLSLKKIYNFSFKIVKLGTLKKYIQDAYIFFIGMLFSMTFNLATIFLIGIYFSMDHVAGFDISLKIVLVFIIPFDVLQQAVFPTISRTKDKSIIKKLLLVSSLVGVFFYFILYYFAEYFLSILGGVEMTSYKTVLQTLALITPLVGVTFILGNCTLIAFGYNKEFNLSLIFSSIFFILTVALLVIFDKLTFWNLIYLRVLSDLVLVLIRIYYTFKKKIIIF